MTLRSAYNRPALSNLHPCNAGCSNDRDTLISHARRCPSTAPAYACAPASCLVVFINHKLPARPRAARERTSPLSAINIHRFHGAATRVSASDTAFGIRREHFMVELIACWRAGDDARHRDCADGRTTATARATRRLREPARADYREQIAHAYGPNAERLLAVKASVDAEHVFTAIPLPTASAPSSPVGLAAGEG